MDCEKRSVAKIVREINERLLREQSRDISSPKPSSRKGAVLLRKSEPGAHPGQNTNLAASPSGDMFVSRRKTLSFEKIVGKSCLHSTACSRDTLESCSHLKTPFRTAGAERHATENTIPECKGDRGTNSKHKNRVTFAENMVTDVFYYEGYAEVEDSELSGEISDTVPQSALNAESSDSGCTQMAPSKRKEAGTERSQPAISQQLCCQTAGDSVDAPKPSSVAGTLSQKTSEKSAPSRYQNPADTKGLRGAKEIAGKDCKEDLCVQAKNSTSCSVEDRATFTNTYKNYGTQEPLADATTRSIDMEASYKLCSVESQTPYGSPDVVRVREEIEAIKKKLSIRDLIRMFEVKIKENRP